MIPSKRITKKHGKEKWELDFGKDGTGKRKRLFFNTEQEADNEVQRLQRLQKSHGDFWVRMSEVERSRVVATLLHIKSKGLTITRVWEDWQRWASETAKQDTTTPQAYEVVVAEWKRRKLAVGKTERYVSNSADVMLKFGTGRLRQNIHEIRPNDLEMWLDAQAEEKKWSLSTKRTYMLLFSSLWEVAIAKGWATLNVIDRLEPVKVIGVDVKIYPNEQTRNIMAAALSNDSTRKVMASLALGFFGCMRPEEICSVKALRAGLPNEMLFGWHDIDLKNGLIKVRKEIAKTGDQRTIRLQQCAVEWLTLAKESGSELPPVNERRLIDACCEMIGLEEWIRDGLRKNCATHLRAVYKNDYDVVKDMGNSVRVLLKHYADLHTPEDVSMAHWQITPKAVKKFIETKEWKHIVNSAQESLPG